MAHILRTKNAKGQVSPFWACKFMDASGRVVMRSTKQKGQRDALKVAMAWEDAAKKARAGELTQAASVKVLRELMEQTGTGSLKTPGIGETLDGYLTACATLGKAKGTLTRYKPIFTRFKAYLGEVRTRASVASLTVSEVEGWRNGEVVAGLSAKSANLGLGIIRAALNVAKRRGEILHNPCDAVSELRERSDERQPLTDADIVKLLKAATGEWADWRGAVLVGAWTGLRLADVARLTWGAVDMVAGTVTITPEKTGKPLVVPVAGELRAYLETLERGVGKAPVFPTLAGRITGRNGGLSNEFARLMKLAGVIAPAGAEKKGRGRQGRLKSFHSLRHAFVSRLVNSDVPADVRKALAGHDTDEAHAKYTHLRFEKQGEALEKLAALGGWQ